MNKYGNFTLNFSVHLLFMSPLCHTALARISNTVLNESDENNSKIQSGRNRHPCLVPETGGKRSAFAVSDIPCNFLAGALFCVEEFLLILICGEYSQDMTS